MASLINYKLKFINEDFQVTEVSLMPTLFAKKFCSFTYLWVQKSGFTTFDVLGHVKNFFKLRFDDIVHQGLKDEDAITEQLISVKKILGEKDVTAFNKKNKLGDKFFQIKYIVGYGKEPVKERMLHGNSFRIGVRNLENSVANNFLNYLSVYRYHYFINYYDNQRFGMPGGPYNTHLIGKAIVENDWKRVYKHIKRTDNISPDVLAKLKNTSDFMFFKLMDSKRVSFFISSYNSFLWNSQASLIIKEHTKSKKHEFENVGFLNLPTMYSFQCPHICEVNGYELITDSFAVKQKVYSRNIVVATTIYAHNLENDELHKNKKKLTLSFFLPTGSYATMVIKQLFKIINVMRSSKN